MTASIKPLTHWAIYRGHKLRFTLRSPAAVEGVLTTPDGSELRFYYDRAARLIRLPGVQIAIDDYGWEVSRETTV